MGFCAGLSKPFSAEPVCEDSVGTRLVDWVRVVVGPCG